VTRTGARASDCARRRIRARIAHIGVLRVLGEAGIPIDCVAGTSVGALIRCRILLWRISEELQRIGSLTTFADFGRWTPSWLGLPPISAWKKYSGALFAAKTFERIENAVLCRHDRYQPEYPFIIPTGRSLPVIRASCAYPACSCLSSTMDGHSSMDFDRAGAHRRHSASWRGPVIAFYLEAANVEQPRTFTDVAGAARQHPQCRSGWLDARGSDIVKVRGCSTLPASR